MTRPGPGKFEGNESLEIATALYEIGLAGDFEDDLYTDDGYLNLVFDGGEDALNAPAYITKEAEDGSFTYIAYTDVEAARDEWNKRILDDQAVNLTRSRK